jgi:glucose/arabinose dehydrogenase
MRNDRRHRQLAGFLSGLVLLTTACGSLSAPAAVTPTEAAASPVASGTPSPSSTPVPPSPVPTATPQPTATLSPYRAAFPDPAGFQWLPVASGLSDPVDIQNAGDGSGRLFLVEKPGRIRILLSGLMLAQPFLDIRAEVGDSYIEQGLLGLAFHPDYKHNGYFYVNYTDTSGNTVIARFQVSSGDSNQADPSSETVLLRVNQPYRNHNGGGLAFGPDGYLYIGMGDGGSAGDPQRNGQNPNTLLGKLLRLDVDGASPYAIPAGNPFASGGGRPEIWAIGLRNPWRFSFDPLTGGLYIGDVGQDRWEEVNFVPAGSPGGLNFGWSAFEANHVYNGPDSPTGMVFPVLEYPHDGGRCSVTGGRVYHGLALPEWQGVYLYGDYCSGQVSGLIRTDGASWLSADLFSTGARVSSFGVDEAGELYLADIGSGTVLELVRR